MPLFEEAKLRGDAKQAQAQLDSQRAQLSDLRGQIDADIRDSFLDLESAAKQVEVARSNMELADQTLDDAQQRYAAGVSDSLAVVQAQTGVITCRERSICHEPLSGAHYVAKLCLWRGDGRGGHAISGISRRKVSRGGTGSGIRWGRQPRTNNRAVTRPRGES